MSEGHTVIHTDGHDLDVKVGDSLWIKWMDSGIHHLTWPTDKDEIQSLDDDRKMMTFEVIGFLVDFDEHLIRLCMVRGNHPPDNPDLGGVRSLWRPSILDAKKLSFAQRQG